MRRGRIIFLLLLVSVISLAQVRSTLFDKNGNVLRVSTEDHVTHTHEAVAGFKLEFLSQAADQWTVPNTSTKINYYGSWAVKDDTRCACSFSKIQNDSLTYYFTDADRIEFWGELMHHHGKADVYFDGKYEVTLDTYGPNDESPTLNWYKEGFDPDVTHSFKLVVKGERNPSATDSYVVLKYLKLFTPEVVPPPLPKCDPITVASGLTVSASNCSVDDSHILTMDGDLNTWWSADGLGEWIQYEFSDFVTMESLDIAFYNGDQRTAMFDIAMSGDGINWNTNIIDQESSGASLNFQKWDLLKTDAKFLRITGKGNSVNTWNSYTEVKINIITTPPPIDPPDPVDTVRLIITGKDIKVVIE